MNCTRTGQNPAKVISIFRKNELIDGCDTHIEQTVELFRATLKEISKFTPSSVAETMDIETRLHREVSRRCLDYFFGRMIQTQLKSPVVLQQAEEVVKRQILFPRLQCSDQNVNLTLLGGSTISVEVPYILNRPPRGPGHPRRKGSRGKSGNGLYPTLEVLGLQFRVTPALAEEVSRLTTLEPLDEAVQLLNRRGILLDRKVVERISNQIGERGLAFCDFLKEEVAKGYRGDAAAGKRLVISVDGGRVRTRVENKKGRKKKNGRRGYRGDWREPKAFTVYEIDEKGRKKKAGILEYDATMGDADALFMRLAVLLCSIGAHLASEWVFIADGAEWIWDRLPKLIADVGYSPDKVTEILDYYHATEHLHALAGEFPGWDEKDKAMWVKRVKKLLKKGKEKEFLNEVGNLCIGSNTKSIARRELAYFTKHGERIAYATFKKRNLPLGSGAMESCIRRLVNLRFKGNGIFWKIETVECRLHLRAQLLSRRWTSYIPMLLSPKAIWDSQMRMVYELQEAA